jgi:hypothetical protein
MASAEGCAETLPTEVVSRTQIEVNGFHDAIGIDHA